MVDRVQSPSPDAPSPDAPAPDAPAPDAGTRVGTELVTLSRRLRNGARSIYAESGLTYVEYSLLSLVAAHPGVNAAALAREAGIDKSTASRQLGELRTRGLLRRRQDELSARSQTLELTADGESILDDIRHRSGAAITRLLADWPAGDLEQFASLLHRYNTAEAR
ncbi:MarR family winged helix-turn-helix transcriptional regulator [Gordonia sp. NPDC003429]